MASALVVKFCGSLRAPVLCRLTAMAPRYSLLGRHDPSLKKKNRQKTDQKKRQKKSTNVPKKPMEILPPVDPEAFVDGALLQPERVRQLGKINEQEKERRILLLKEWSRYRNQERRNELRRLQSVVMSRELALRELKKTSAWLYEEAIKKDEKLFPLHLQGPTETPPVPGYIAPDAID